MINKQKENTAKKVTRNLTPPKNSWRLMIKKIKTRKMQQNQNKKASMKRVKKTPTKIILKNNKLRVVQLTLNLRFLLRLWMNISGKVFWIVLKLVSTTNKCRWTLASSILTTCSSVKEKISKLIWKIRPLKKSANFSKLWIKKDLLNTKKPKRVPIPWSPKFTETMQNIPNGNQPSDKPPPGKKMKEKKKNKMQRSLKWK